MRHEFHNLTTLVTNLTTSNRRDCITSRYYTQERNTGHLYKNKEQALLRLVVTGTLVDHGNTLWTFSLLDGKGLTGSVPDGPSTQ